MERRDVRSIYIYIYEREKLPAIYEPAYSVMEERGKERGVLAKWFDAGINELLVVVETNFVDSKSIYRQKIMSLNSR